MGLGGRVPSATRAMVKVEAGRKVLRVAGVIQSVAVDEQYESDVWDAMVPQIKPVNALILGLGGGAIATLMTQKWGAVPITGVESDPEVAWLARHEFGLSALPNVSIVVEDAFRFVSRSTELYDAVSVDLYVGGKMAHGVLGGGFLRDICRILVPNGSVSFNLWRSAYLDDQLRRLERQVVIRDIVEVDNNIIVTCSHKSS